jgi:isopentenyl-diphosphate Delta-isomerase
MNTGQFEERKREHIRHSLDHAHQAVGLSGLDRVHLVHEALPELNFEELRIEAPCFSRALSTPFYVAGMTAGHPDAVKINRTLAQACATRGWAMGVGSQRRELEAPSQSLDLWKELRRELPELVLFSNIGISQLIHASVQQIRDIVDGLGANALAVHVNALQEALQPEGTPQFRGGVDALRKVCEELGKPVVLKETGCGFSKTTLHRLSDTGLAAIDVSGLGGTHWGRIEGARSSESGVQTPHARASVTFADWGESTVQSILAARQVLNLKKCEIWASGGVRTGLDAAKLIALGAHRVGYAQPALSAAIAGVNELLYWMESQEFELKVALFCTGAATIEGLREPSEEKGEIWKFKET